MALKFMKHFDEEIRRLHKNHWHTYPKTPKMNAHVERFNRTIQEEFIDYHEELLITPNEFNRRLIPWLIWYNAEKPHWGLELNSPVQFLLKQNPTLCKTWWPNTCRRQSSPTTNRITKSPFTAFLIDISTGQPGPERLGEVLRMAGFRVGNHFLISRPHYDETLRAWVPYVRVITNLSNYGGAVPEKFKFHVVDGFKETFESEEEAVFFGISKAEAWLQEPPPARSQISHTRSS